MALQDTVCTLVPYFQVQEGQLEAFKALGEQMVERTKNEDGVAFYGFSFNDHQAHCREGYKDADGVLAHLGNVDALLKEALAIASIERLEVHGPASEVEKLREPLAGLNPTFFVMESGFRR